MLPLLCMRNKTLRCPPLLPRRHLTFQCEVKCYEFFVDCACERYGKTRSTRPPSAAMIRFFASSRMDGLAAPRYVFKPPRISTTTASTPASPTASLKRPARYFPGLDCLGQPSTRSFATRRCQSRPNCLMIATTDSFAPRGQRLHLVYWTHLKRERDGRREIPQRGYIGHP